MRTSPRRPLILKRRKLALPGDDAAASQHSATKDETDGTGKAVPSGQQPNDPAAHPQKFPTGIKIVNHPTMPNTQVVFIPKHANIQSIIAALTAKGKECGSTGPNKFILISGGGSLRPAWSQGPHVQVDRDLSVGEGDILRTGVEGCKSVAQDQDAVEMEDDMLLQTVKHLAPRAHPKYEEDSNSGGSANCALDESLTNIQWLGKMSSDVLGSCSVREELEDKENHPPEPEGPRNSIRHNLSLHDMFVRETSANGKVSFWTIHPDANRCLTLDQVFKPLDQGSPIRVQTCEPQQKRLLPELQKVTPGCSGMKSEGPGGSGTTERKMKLLLPRVNSYFVPVHFPQNQQFLQQPVGKTSLSSAPVSTADQAKSNKRVQIVPKATVHGGNGSPFLPIQSSLEIPIAKSEELPSAVIKEEEEDENPFSCSKEKISYTALKSPAWKMPDMQSSMLDGGPTHILLQSSVKEETTTALKDCRFEVLREDVPLAAWKEEKALPAVKSPVRRLSDSQVIRRRKSSSRRKQHLSIPCAEEPLIVFPDCSNSDSGLVSDFSFLQDTHPLEPSTDLNCTQETFAFKTPIKEKSVKHPASSTPSKPVGTVATTGGSEQWRLPPLNKEGSLPDFSPVRLPQGTALTPFKDSLDLLGFSSPPFHDLPLFDSPQQLLNNKSPDIPSGPFTSSPTLAPHAPKRCSKELPIGGSTNRSLTEGLVLDTMNDSLSKILLDISFTGLEDDDDFEGDNVSWSHLIPELR
ncbi:forkhead box protein M1 isoform X3 [Ambystoma mexicanum]|uniref:forkhead box protein M1 isoform X3 n=1 Tax=Ambystoma mexicanum TaxID=8296 RepID=UPI0037E77514